MKRTDKDPTYVELVELLEADPLGRTSDLAGFVEILASIEGGLTLFLDGDWGVGKTFFVKQLKMILDEINPSTEHDEELKRIIGSSLKLGHLAKWYEANGEADGDSLSGEPPAFTTVYYNAWENDHWDDPLPSLIQTMAWTINKDGRVDGSTSEQKIVRTIDAILQPLHLDILTRGREALAGESLLANYEERLQVRGKVAELVRMGVHEEGERMLLIIDELDRCRPTFALRLLEQVKALFATDDLVVLYSVNTKELSKTIESQYGVGFDAARYLARFYDAFFSLRVPKNEAYLAYSGIPNDSYRSHAIAHEMVQALNMSLRDQNRYRQDLDRVEDLKHPQNTSGVVGFCENAFSTLMLAIKSCRLSDYIDIADSRDVDKLMEYAVLSPAFGDYVDMVIGDRERIMRKEMPESTKFFDRGYEINMTDEERARLEAIHQELRRTILEATLMLVFVEVNYSDQYRQAYQLLASGDFFGRDLTYIAHGFLR